MKYKNEVYWYTLQNPEINELTENTSSDVLIIGGGMTGLMAALAFSERGKSVVILEKDFCGGGASGKSSGFITPDSELELSNLIPAYGETDAKKIWEFVCAGVEEIRKLIQQNNIDCDYQEQDSLFIASSKGKISKVKEELESREKLGYNSVFYGQNELSKVIGSKKYFSAVRYPKTYGINGYLFCQGLRKILIGKGVKIFEKAFVESLNYQGAHVGSFTVSAETTVVCGDRFIPDLKKHKSDIYHGQTFLCVSKILSDAQINAIFPGDKLMVWDTDLIYQYFRITGDNRLLIGGSNIPFTYASQESRPAHSIYKKLSSYVERMFPAAKVELEYMWPGLIGVTKDFLPIVARDKMQSNIYYAGAGAGLPWSAAIGRYTAEKILDNRSEFDNYFDPKRFKTANWVQIVLGRKLAFAIFQGLRKL